MPQLSEVTGLLLLVLAISVLPFFAMVVTSYTKIIVVLGLVRNALGVQQVPPNMVINSVAIMLTCYVMAPIGYAAADGVSAGKGDLSAATLLDAADRAKTPFKDFLLKHAGARERAFFLRSAGKIWPPAHAKDLKDDDLIVLAPSFTLTELTHAFKIGLLLYLVFIIVDLAIANVLMAMGMNQVNPTNVAIPFKLLLFVALDGWSTLIHGLVLTYR